MMVRTLWISLDQSRWTSWIILRDWFRPICPNILEDKYYATVNKIKHVQVITKLQFANLVFIYDSKFTRFRLLLMYPCNFLLIINIFLTFYQEFFLLFKIYKIYTFYTKPNIFFFYFLFKLVNYTRSLFVSVQTKIMSKIKPFSSHQFLFTVLK